MTTYHTENLTIENYDVRIEYWYDEYIGKPWEEYDGHGDIRETRAYYGHPDKKPGEIIIHQDWGTWWIYDFAGAVEKAKSEGWGCKESEGLTPNQVAAKAATEDMNYCRRWLDDKWHWAGFTVTVIDDNGDEIESDSCGGFESDTDYFKESAHESAKNLVEQLIKKESERKESERKESEARQYWASRDIVTI